MCKAIVKVHREHEYLPDPDEEIDALVMEALALLSPHMDAVEIICTRYDPDNRVTSITNYGRGNWHARYGAICDAMDRMNARLGGGDEDDE